MDITTEEMEEAINRMCTNDIKRMDKYIKENISKKFLLEKWFRYGVPNEATEEDYKTIGSDIDWYDRCCYHFMKIITDKIEI